MQDLDVSQPLSPETIATLRDAVLRFPALIIPGQQLTPEQLLAFGRAFGDLQPHTAERYRHPEFPELSFVSNVDRDGKIDEFGQQKRATGWHSDGSYLKVPYSLTLLYCVEAPSNGGKTLFANMCKAYEALPDEMKRRVDGATAVHAVGSGPDGATAPSAGKRQQFPDLFPDIEKPLIQVHPETGRKVLFLNPTHTSHIVGDDREECERLYHDLVAFSTQPQFVYEHSWKVGDVVIWDQRSTLHRGGGGIPRTERRVMLRTLVKGLEAAA